MSFGKPIVTTDVGDAAAVAGKAGIAVPARDPQALADAMRAFLDLPEAGMRAMRARRGTHRE